MIKLEPGLAATAEIKTRRRRIIEYLLSPLARCVSEAGREIQEVRRRRRPDQQFIAALGLCALAFGCAKPQLLSEEAKRGEVLEKTLNSASGPIGFNDAFGERDLLYICVMDEYTDTKTALDFLIFKGRWADSNRHQIEEVYVPEGRKGLLLVFPDRWVLVTVLHGVISQFNRCFSADGEFVRNSDRTWSITGKSFLE